MLKGLGNLEDEILSSLFGVISSKREDMENKWKNTQKLKKIKKMFEPLTKWWKDLIKDEVDDVVVSKKLVDDPLVVVS
jgi:HSP90 family molecular chaperone